MKGNHKSAPFGSKRHSMRGEAHHEVGKMVLPGRGARQESGESGRANAPKNRKSMY